MRAAIVTFLIAAAVAANARPDVSLGYKYNTPQDQYAGATPDHSAFAAIGGLSGGHQQTEHGYQQQQNQFSSIPSTVSSFVSSGSIGGSASGSGNVYQTGGYQQQQHQISASVPSTATTYVSSSSNSAAAGNAYQTGGISSTVASGLAQNQYYSSSGAQSAHTYTGSAATTTSGGSIVGTSSSFVQPATYSTSSSSLSSSSGSSSTSGAARLEASALPPIITKSFYFEAAPEEPEEQQGPRFVPVGRAQKNYKVIFIKAPSYGLNSQIIPVVPQNEEKTIIYVLSKKPEFNQDIELPPVPTTEPSKPEIFFVKYKSEQEALEAQHKIKNVYETNQPSVEGDARFDDQHIHTIVSEAVPNVYSAASGAGSGQQSSGSINAVRQHLSVNGGGNIGSVGSGASFSRLEQRFGGAEEESQVQAAEQQSNVQAEPGSGSAGGYTLVSEQVQDNSAGHENVQSAHQSGGISSIGDGSSSAGLISVNFVDLNNAGAVEAAAAAAEHVLGGGETEPEYLPPNHGHY